MQIVSFAASKNRDQGRDLIFIELFYKGCLSCDMHQSMTYQCNSLRPLFAVIANAIKHTHTHTIKRAAAAAAGETSRASLMSGAPWSLGEAYISTRLLLPLWQINKSGLKLKGIQPSATPHPQPTSSPSTRWVQSCGKYHLFSFFFNTLHGWEHSY